MIINRQERKIVSLKEILKQRSQFGRIAVWTVCCVRWGQFGCIAFATIPLEPVLLFMNKTQPNEML
uniref:Uncharacterized protein n=1 Tax=Heterorhabditis bacteriophora TaxID=37862 RepID=A0A1I7WL79_HETBA